MHTSADRVPWVAAEIALSGGKTQHVMLGPGIFHSFTGLSFEDFARLTPAQQRGILPTRLFPYVSFFSCSLLLFCSFFFFFFSFFVLTL